MKHLVGTVLCGFLVATAVDGVAKSEPMVERGSYLVNTIMACGDCHTPRDADGNLISDKPFSGGLTFNTPAFVATARNITPDRETGIGAWTDDEIRKALIEGKRPNHGHLADVPLAVVMPVNFYKALLPDDLTAIVVYLRSSKPIHNEVPDPVYKAPVTRQPYPDAERGFSKAQMSVPVEHGRYLATVGHCMLCHSAFSRGVSDFTDGLGRGGRVFPASVTPGLGPTFKGSVAANITSDRVAGIGAWSDDEIKRAIKGGISRDGHKLKPPMPSHFFAGLADSDVNDIIAYLRTVPPSK